MGITVKYNNSAIKKVQKNIDGAMIDAAEDVLEKVKEDIPVDTGNLRDKTIVDTTAAKRGKVSIKSDTDYAKAVYYDPEAAGNHWFAGMEDVTKSSFKKNLKRRMKK
jgi:hypothetical protein